MPTTAQQASLAFERRREVVLGYGDQLMRSDADQLQERARR